MHGNVREWCHDGLRTYTKEAQVNPAGPLDDHASRVFRGGSWNDQAQYCRAACRFADAPGFRWCGLGLRLAAGQEPAEPPGAAV